MASPICLVTAATRRSKAAPSDNSTVGVGTLPGRPAMSVLNASCPADSCPTVLCAQPIGARCSVTEVVVIAVFLSWWPAACFPTAAAGRRPPHQVVGDFGVIGGSGGAVFHHR